MCLLFTAWIQEAGQQEWRDWNRGRKEYKLRKGVTAAVAAEGGGGVLL